MQCHAFAPYSGLLYYNSVVIAGAIVMTPETDYPKEKEEAAGKAGDRTAPSLYCM